MEKISDKYKGISMSPSPSRSPSNSRKLSRSSSLNFEVDHPSPKSPSDTQPVIFPDSHQASLKV